MKYNFKENRVQFVLENFHQRKHEDYLDWMSHMLEYWKDDQEIVNFIESWRPKIAVYAGSFDPWHIGHFNILVKAEEIFDKVIIARGINPDKEGMIKTHFDLPDAIRDRQICNYEGLLTEFMDNLGYETTLIRGLRNGNDLAYETTQAAFLRDLKPDIKIVHIVCDKEYEHISSSAIRSLMKYGEIYKNYLM